MRKRVYPEMKAKVGGLIEFRKTAPTW
jgi:hypothetical protein